MSMFDLSGKVAIVTGGNGGIGLGIARGLVGAGASVVLSGRNSAKGDAAARDIGAAAAFVQAEVSRKADCQALVAAAVSRFGRLDILVNNAGTNIRRKAENYTEAEWHTIMDTNLSGTFFLCQAAHPEMVKAGGGKIINIGSMMSLFGAPFAVVYAASKGGMTQLTKALATAWAPDNIQVNAVLPGWIDTDLTRSARAAIPGLYETVLARLPAARWGVPADLAGLAVFLAAPASNYITGTMIPVDGGYSARG
jgi:2-dehydro-3-deoxy-D-gluconate 5-dehydrogenase